MDIIIDKNNKNESTTKITTMCALINNNDVLMINRRKNWKGWAFPGGHLEPKESIIECVIREMREETGLTILDPIFKGITHFYDNCTGDRHIIFNYTAFHFEGELTNNCYEGKICWIPQKDIMSLELAEGMEHRLELFFNRGISEMHVVWTKGEGYIKKEMFSYST